MKKYLYWGTFPVIMLVFILSSIIEGMSNIICEACHKWEGWCFEYHKQYPKMHYKGDGIWVTYKEKTD